MANRSDDFNRTNSAVALGTPSDGGSAWAAQTGTWGVSSNQGYNPSGGAADSAYLESSVAAGEVSVTFTVLPATIAGTFLRGSDGSNLIWSYVRPGTTNVRIMRRQAGANTQIGTATVTSVAGDRYRFTVSGNTYNLYRTPSGGSESLVIGPITDSFNATATRVGLYAQNEGSARFDDFVFYDPAAGGGGSVQAPRSMHQYRMRRAA